MPEPMVEVPVARLQEMRDLLAEALEYLTPTTGIYESIERTLNREVSDAG